MERMCLLLLQSSTPEGKSTTRVGSAISTAGVNVEAQNSTSPPPRQLRGSPAKKPVCMHIRKEGSPRFKRQELSSLVGTGKCLGSSSSAPGCEELQTQPATLAASIVLSLHAVAVITTLSAMLRFGFVYTVAKGEEKRAGDERERRK
jgi:hypothetical protein